jgi:hypothetical protein
MLQWIARDLERGPGEFASRLSPQCKDLLRQWAHAANKHTALEHLSRNPPDHVASVVEQNHVGMLNRGAAWRVDKGEKGLVPQTLTKAVWLSLQQKSRGCAIKACPDFVEILY